MDRGAAHEADLLHYATERLKEVPGLRPIGEAERKAAVLSFALGDIHPHDVATILDRRGVAVRAGHHCAQPVMERFGLPATTRASLALYNTREDVDALIDGLRAVLDIFG
jgi:cysteine desulfurase/selenocysteine lyase